MDRKTTITGRTVRGIFARYGLSISDQNAEALAANVSFMVHTYACAFTAEELVDGEARFDAGLLEDNGEDFCSYPGHQPEHFGEPNTVYC